MFAPVIPGLNDHELEGVLQRAAEAGAFSAGYVVLRLPLEIKDLFREWLAANVPDRASRVMSLVRQMRGGKDYDAQWGQRMKGEGPNRRRDRPALQDRAAAVRVGYRALPPLDVSQFKVPHRRLATRGICSGERALDRGPPASRRLSRKMPARRWRTKASYSSNPRVFKLSRNSASSTKSSAWKPAALSRRVHVSLRTSSKKRANATARFPRNSATLREGSHGPASASRVSWLR